MTEEQCQNCGGLFKSSAHLQKCLKENEKLFFENQNDKDIRKLALWDDMVKTIRAFAIDESIMINTPISEWADTRDTKWGLAKYILARADEIEKEKGSKNEIYNKKQT